MNLFPYQEEGVKFLTSRKRAALLDEQGLGKTIQAIVAVKKSVLDGKILVLCPLSLVQNWKNEIAKWDTFSDGRRYTVRNWDYLITEGGVDRLMETEWDVIIGDETHEALKNWEAKRCRYFIHLLAPKAKRLILMTGTPITNSAADLHPLLSVMEPGKWGKFEDFCERYCKKKTNNYKERGFDYYGFRNTKELYPAVRRIGLRRKKSEVLPDLPPKLHSYIPVQICTDELPNPNIENISHICPEDDAYPPSISTLMRTLGESKVKSSIEFLVNMIDPGSPVVVFGYHKSVLNAIYAGLATAGYRVGIITGETPTDRRQEYIDYFQKGELDFLLGNTAMARGYTLTAADKLVHVEFFWSPKTMEQADDRIHRIGQKNCVNIYYLFAEGTFDEKIMGVLQYKNDGINMCIDGDIPF